VKSLDGTRGRGFAEAAEAGIEIGPERGLVFPTSDEETD
jgi:hypothetical protein